MGHCFDLSSGEPGSNLDLVPSEHVLGGPILTHTTKLENNLIEIFV